MLFVCAIAHAQNAALMPVPMMQFADHNGAPLAGGMVYTCTAGTSCVPSRVGDPALHPLATYTDSTAGTANTNPVILDSAGRASIWMLPANSYKIVLLDASGVQQWTQDSVTSGTLFSNSQSLATAAQSFANTLWPSAPYLANSFGAVLGSSGTYHANTPADGFYFWTRGDSAIPDIVGMHVITQGTAASGTYFGQNTIVTTSGGISLPKLVGTEIDVEPPAGVTPGVGSSGLYINVFNAASPGAMIQTGGINGGTFNNGIVLGGIAPTGAGLSGGAGQTMDSLVNCGSATYNDACLIMPNQQKLIAYGPSGTPAQMYVDSSNSLRIVPGPTGTINFRDATNVSTTGVISAGRAILSQGLFLTTSGGGAKPTCISSLEGLTWYSPGSGSTSGAFEVCQNQSGTMQWVSH